MKSTKFELVNDAHTIVRLPNNFKVVFKINQAFSPQDSNQTEELLQPHQVREFGIIVDDCESRHLSTSGSTGTQCIKVGDRTLPMYFDG